VGSPRVRWLLVEAAWGVAWRILRIRDGDTAPRRVAERIRVRRGTRVAVVALARRLAGIL
jgi:hypothetical protein